MGIRWEFKLPDLGEGVEEGEVVTWLVNEGDNVTEDTPLIEVMTDKATSVITSPKSGKIIEIRCKKGDIVPIHFVLAVFVLDFFDVKSDMKFISSFSNGHHLNKVKEEEGYQIRFPKMAVEVDSEIKMNQSEIGHAGKRPQLSQPLLRKSQVDDAGGAPLNLRPDPVFDDPPATPVTRKLARDLGVDLKDVKATGPEGRVTKQDVENYILTRDSKHSDEEVGETSPQRSPSQSKAEQAHDLSHVTAASPSSKEERVPFAGMRRKIATKMAQSKHTAAHFTFVEECDVSSLKNLRRRFLPAAETLGVKLSFLPFIVKAVVTALKKHPILNSFLDEVTSELVYRKDYNIGVAVATEAGLIVPVVKDADSLSLVEIAKEIDRLARDAKSGRSKSEDLTGSSFTITSLGKMGGLFATPILHFPEVGILGVHQMKERAVVRNGKIEVGEVMLLSLSFDHRIVDGHVGAAFAYEVIAYLEDPDKLFFEMA